MRVLKMSSWATVLWFAFLPVDATAHHSSAATFDVRTINELEGVVTQVQWRNPHVRFTIRTMDGQGKEKLYEIETHSLSILRRMDITSDVLPVGERVRVAGHPARRTENGLFVLHVLLPDGQEIVFDPSGEPRWSDQTIGTNATWQATEGDASRHQAGIFRVWSTTFSGPDRAMLFPEGLDPTLVDNYPLQDSARQALAAFDPLTDAPTLNCAPKGMPTIMGQPYPMEFVEEGDNILLRMEEYDTLRTIHLSAVAGVNQSPSRLGHSVGHWEGSSLVVRTTNLNWPHFDTIGIPLSDAAEIVERFTPSADGARLDYAMTVTDAATFTAPVVMEKRWLALDGIQVQPYECTN